jgi:hypothetical protein
VRDFGDELQYISSHPRHNSEMKAKQWTILILLGALLIGFAFFIPAISQPPGRSYSFIPMDHAVSMLQDGKDRWSYYNWGIVAVSTVAEQARKELVPLGFREDSSQRPWFRFIKSNQEVIVCDHSEFYFNGSKPMISKPPPGPNPGSTPYGMSPSVLVKNGPGTEGSMLGFQVRKLIHGW